MTFIRRFGRAAVLACAVSLASAALRDAAYCSANMAVLFNGPYMGLFQDTRLGFASGCNQVFTVGVDGGGNFALNRLDFRACDFSALVVYKADTPDDGASVRLVLGGVGFDDPTQVTFGPCNATEGSALHLASGTYCGAENETIVAHGSAMLWRTAASYGPLWDCGYAIGYGDMSASGFNPVVTSGGCLLSLGSFAPPTTQSVIYDTSSGSISVFFADRLVSMATTACTATGNILPAVNKSYCVANGTASPWEGAAFHQLTNSTYELVLTNGGYLINEVCVVSGSIASLGSALTVTLRDVYGTCTTVSELLGITYDATADSVGLLTNQTGNFTATPCEVSALVPSGTFCAGKEATLHVADRIFTIVTDKFDLFACRIDGVLLLDGTTAQVTTNCSGIQAELSIVVANDTVYVAGNRNNSGFGYAFRQDACGLGAYPGLAGSFCASGDFGDAVLQVAAESFALTFNRTWLSSAQQACVFLGTLWARGSHVSYHIVAQGCSRFDIAPAAHILRDFTLRTAESESSYSFDLVNSANGTVDIVTLNYCPATPAPALAQAAYCGPFGDVLYVKANNFYLISADSRFAVVGQFRLVNASYATASTDAATSLARSFNGAFHILSPTAVAVVPALAMTDSFGFDSAACSGTWVQASPERAGAYCASTDSATAVDGNVSLLLYANRSVMDLTLVASGGDHPCHSTGFAMALETVYSLTFFNVVGCERWKVHYLARDPATEALSLALEYDDGGIVLVSLSNGTCTSWEQGVASGFYCPLPSNFTTTAPTLVAITGNEYVGRNPTDTRSIFANFTRADNNLSFISGWDLDGVPKLPSASIHAVGSRGLSVSGRALNASYSIGVSLDACMADAPPLTDRLLATEPYAQFDDFRIIAAFSADGTFAIELPTAFYCFVEGWYAIGAGQLTLRELTRTGCRNFTWAFSAGVVGADGSISLDMWLANGSVPVLLSEANCGLIDGGVVPSGIYCDGLGSKLFLCNGDMLRIYVGGIYEVGILAARNASIQGSQRDGTRFLFSYNTSTGRAWYFSLSNNNTYVRSYSLSMCSLGPQDWTPAAVGAYCGADVAGSPVTLLSLPRGSFGISYNPAIEGSANAVPCYRIGTMEFTAPGVGEAAFLSASSGCTLAGGAPRLRVETIQLDNATGTLVVTGYVLTSPNATAMPVTYVLTRGDACAALQEQPPANATATPYLPAGVYAATGVRVTSTIVLAGPIYGFHTLLGGSVFRSFGRYVPTAADVQAFDAGLPPASNIINSSYAAATGVLHVIALLDLNRVVLPLLRQL